MTKQLPVPIKKRLKVRVEKQEADVIVIGQFKLTKCGMEISGSPGWRDWVRVGRFIQRASAASSLWLGDWLNFGETRFGEKYTQALDDTRLDYQTLRNICYVSRNVPLEVRQDNLGFGHHAEVASLPDGEQKQFLQEAVEKGWTKNELRSKVRDWKRSKGMIGLDKLLIENQSVDLIQSDLQEQEQIGNFQLALWQPNFEVLADVGSFLATFSKIYESLEPGGVLVVFSPPPQIPTVVQAVRTIDSPVWICATHKECEVDVQRNVLNLWTAGLIFRKHPKRSFSMNIKDMSTQRALVEDLSQEAHRVLVYRPEDTYLPQYLKDKEMVILEPSPKYYELLKGPNEEKI
jgi:hypothetical protein